MTTATIFIYTCVVAVFGVGVIVALGGWGAELLDLAVRKTLDLDGWDKEEADAEETRHKEEEDIETLDIDDAEATLVSTDKIPIHHSHATTSHPHPHHPTLIFNLKAPK